VAGCLADAGVRGEVIALACDGTGYGADGTVWGGEILRADEADFVRLGHLRTFGLVGGDRAARETWRPAAGLLSETFGADWPAAARQTLLTAGQADRDALDFAATLLTRRDRRVFRTSSVGRLFDAAAALLGICPRNTYEGQAPMTLEALAARAGLAEAPDAIAALGWNLDRSDGAIEMDPRPLVADLLTGRARGESPERLAGAFHAALIEMLAAGALAACETARLDRVVLTGGCFANRILLTGVWEKLRAAGLSVYSHGRTPPGDGGVSLGQAVVAAARLARGDRSPSPRARADAAPAD
jgi:hydrogenase maturation protein HypF